MGLYRNIFLDSGFALGGATAYLYCAGTAKYGGYLGVLRLDSDVLGRSFHQVLYQGFLVSFAPTLTVLFILTCASFSYAYMALPAWSDWLAKRFKRKRGVIKFKRKIFGRRKISTREVKAQRQSRFWLKAFLSVLGFLLLLAHFESEGKSEAEHLLERSLKDNLPKSSFVKVETAGRSRTLVALACGSRVCAGLDKKTNRIFYYDYFSSSYFSPTAN